MFIRKFLLFREGRPSRTGPLILLLAALAATACSPEEGRARSGGPGADVGNRPDASTQALPKLHPAMDPAYGTPRVGLASAK